MKSSTGCQPRQGRLGKFGSDCHNIIESIIRVSNTEAQEGERMSLHGGVVDAGDNNVGPMNCVWNIAGVIFGNDRVVCSLPVLSIGTKCHKPSSISSHLYCSFTYSIQQMSIQTNDKKQIGGVGKIVTKLPFYEYLCDVSVNYLSTR